LEQKFAYRHRTFYMEGQDTARDINGPLCKDADSVWHTPGSCIHSEVIKVYSTRKSYESHHERIPEWQLGYSYCTADVGTAVAMEHFLGLTLNASPVAGEPKYNAQVRFLS
jgi:hypothetical protein